MYFKVICRPGFRVEFIVRISQFGPSASFSVGLCIDTGSDQGD